MNPTLEANWKNVEPLSQEEATRLSRMAHGAFVHHGKKGDFRTGCGGPEFCGTCALTAYTETETPNYAGWERVYVEAGRAIREADLLAAFTDNDNPAYVDALRRSCKTFGVYLRS